MLVRKALFPCIAIGVIAWGLLASGPIAAQTCTGASNLNCTNSGTIAVDFLAVNNSNPGTTALAALASNGRRAT